MPTFQNQLHLALRHNRASSSYLSAFAQAPLYYLDRTALFSRIKTKKSGNPESALVLLCQLATPATSSSEVIKVLEQVWKDELTAGNVADAFEIEEQAGRIEMRFVAVWNQDVITGRIVVVGFTSSS
ncbi:MAG TPA: hypothetical protein VF707_09365 [Ardenticatenaceae bacterium]